MGGQRIGPLTPLEDIERWIEASIAPVEATGHSAFAGTLAADLRAGRTAPPEPAAAIDGYAVIAEETFGASLYTPVRLTETLWLDEGLPLPSRFDAVLPPDAVTFVGDVAEAAVTVAPGENVRAAGSDGRAGEILREAGGPATVGTGIAAGALGAGAVAVVRPAVLLCTCGALPEAGRWAGFVLAAFGCAVTSTAHGVDGLDRELRATGADAALVIGGTGQGSDDAVAATLTRVGALAFHGVALDPGERAAIGTVDGRPVLAVPPRPEEGLAVLLTLGRSLVRRLMGARFMPLPVIRGRLTRKVVGAPGRTRLVYVDVGGDRIEPLGSAGLPLASLARAVGALVLPPGLEGHPEGTLVDVMPLPGYPAV